MNRLITSNIGWQAPRHFSRWVSLVLFVFTMVAVPSVWAGPREQAFQIHKRVAGVPPSEAVLTQMAALLATNNPADAAEAVRIAMRNDGFYNVVIKNMATPWTNRAQTMFAPLNDYVATVAGLVRDDDDFRNLLFEDVIYTGGSGLPAYSNANNAHYQAMQDQGLSLKDNLVRKVQSTVNGLPANATAGVLTSRAAAKAFFIDGTNRAMFRFTLMNHMCRDLEQVHDITLVPDYIRQDVSRSPGGDSRAFLNGCIGCHTGMDPMAKAFAYYDFEHDVADLEGDNGSLHYNTSNDTQLDIVTNTMVDTGTRVEHKYLQNSTNFPFGYVTTNDDWENYWRVGQNSSLGWDPALPGKGSGATAGAKYMAKELAYSKAFSSCQVEKVFKQVCLRKPADSTDYTKLAAIEANFKSSGYHLKQVFIDTALYCSGN